MKSSNQKSNYSAQAKSAGYQRRLITLCSAFAALILFFLPSAPAAAQAYNRLISLSNVTLFSNMNPQAVTPGVTPGVGTLFALKPQPGGYEYEITQVQTYHRTSTPGAIRIYSVSGQLLFSGNAQVAPASAGYEMWVVNLNPPLQVAPNTSLIFEDSDPKTWVHDPGSAGCLPFNVGFQCGMGAVYGNVVAMQPVAAPAPAPAPAPQPGFPQRCVSNTYAFMKIEDPCIGGAGYMMKLLAERPLPYSLGLVKLNFLPPGTNTVSAVASPPNSPFVTVALPAGGPKATGSVYEFALPAAAMCALGGNASLWQVTPFYVNGAPIGIPAGTFKLVC